MIKYLTDNIKPILAIFIMLCTYGYFFALLFIDRKPDPQVIIAVVATSSTAMQYYFGNSTGAAKKDETINTLAENKKA